MNENILIHSENAKSTNMSWPWSWNSILWMENKWVDEKWRQTFEKLWKKLVYNSQNRFQVQV